MKRIISIAMLMLLLTGLLTLASNVQMVKASGTVYIRADGSVDPPTAPITTVDNVTYTFTDNIYDEIVVERNNIVVDGAGYEVRGTGLLNSKGIDLSSTINVTIKHLLISAFSYGVFMNLASNNTIVGNNITHNNFVGVYLGWLSSKNVILGNNITYNPYGVNFVYSSNNLIFKNNITDNSWYGIDLGSSFDGNYSSNNMVFGNNVIENGRGGIFTQMGRNNKIYHNNFVNNKVVTAYPYYRLVNIWDDGYPAGGNYWNDYVGVDLYSGPQQNETGCDGIGDTPYIIDVDNQDRYPLIHPWSSLPVHNINTGLGYATIQEAINANETQKGHTIFVEAGTYYENVIINKTISLIGENRNSTIIDVNGKGTVVIIAFSASNTSINGFTIRNSDLGHPGYGYGMEVYGDNSNICGNIISNNRRDGLFLWCDNSTVHGNILESNSVGIFLFDCHDSIITQNVVSNNTYGIYLSGSSSNNTIFHNNLINNTNQAYVDAEYVNTWDDGYPSGGNYWSDYAGVDLHSGINQGQPESDGVGDTPYYIDENNIDRYPLMNPWSLIPTLHTFSIVWGEETFIVSVESNSTVSNFIFNQPDKEISFNVAGEVGTIGFCNATIPNALLYAESIDWIVLINGTHVLPATRENATHFSLYFTYIHSTHTIQIVGTWVIGPLPVVTTSIDFDHNTLNLKSKGEWITIYIELPEGYNVSDIDVFTILLNTTIPVAFEAPITLGDYDNDTITDLNVRFNRTLVADHILSEGITSGNVTLALTGNLYNGTSFGGSANIKVSSLAGDVNCDGKVDLFDIIQAAASYGSKEGDPNWNANANYASTYGIIDILDIVTIAGHYGKTYP